MFGKQSPQAAQVAYAYIGKPSPLRRIHIADGIITPVAPARVEVATHFNEDEEKLIIKTMNCYDCPNEIESIAILISAIRLDETMHDFIGRLVFSNDYRTEWDYGMVKDYHRKAQYYDTRYKISLLAGHAFGIVDSILETLVARFTPKQLHIAAIMKLSSNSGKLGNSDKSILTDSDYADILTISDPMTFLRKTNEANDKAKTKKVPAEGTAVPAVEASVEPAIKPDVIAEPVKPATEPATAPDPEPVEKVIPLSENDRLMKEYLAGSNDQLNQATLDYFKYPDEIEYLRHKRAYWGNRFLNQYVDHILHPEDTVNELMGADLDDLAKIRLAAKEAAPYSLVSVELITCNSPLIDWLKPIFSPAQINEAVLNLAGVRNVEDLTVITPAEIKTIEAKMREIYNLESAKAKAADKVKAVVTDKPATQHPIEDLKTQPLDVEHLASDIKTALGDDKPKPAQNPNTGKRKNHHKK